MKKNEALKAAIDGKNIRPVIPYTSSTVEYLYFDKSQNCFMVVWKDKSQVQQANGNSWSALEWEIAPEYVDFTEALKAYKNGKTIQSVKGLQYSMDPYVGRSLYVVHEEIDGEWIIVER